MSRKLVRLRRGKKLAEDDQNKNSQVSTQVHVDYIFILLYYKLPLFITVTVSSTAQTASIPTLPQSHKGSSLFLWDTLNLVD